MKRNEVYPLDSHPMDGRINIVEDGIVPTLTDKLRKGSADGPLLLIVKDINVSNKTVYKIDAMESNAMKSKNPHSGIHEVNVINCLDTSCLNPSCNQGGIVIVESICD